MIPRIGLARLTVFALLALAGMAVLAPPAAAELKPKPGPKPTFEFTPIVYEVSTGGTDQKKLMQIFAAVNESNGGTLTRDEFVRRLKAREHFEIRFPVKCHACNGWKRITPDRGKRGKDGKVDCKTCRGRGVEMRPHIVTWRSGVLTHLGDRRDPALAALLRKLGDKASAQEWFATARSFHSGDQSKQAGARASAHAAYQQAIAKANAAWRPEQPASSEHNKLHRYIIDESLAGIAATAPVREKKAPE